MTERPLVSVLMTAYNREKYIAGAIESVIAGTYREWELIITDDCSSDATFSIAEHYAAKDKRIRLFRNEKNLGDYPNRNRAASLARGKYLKYLDADDMIYPHSLEIMTEAMEKFPEAALGISQEVGEDLDPYPFLLSPAETYRRHFLGRGILHPGPTATIIRRDVFEALGGFSGTRYIGDNELWLKITALYPLVKIQGGLTFWRKHDEQEFKKGNLHHDYLGLTYQVSLQALMNPLCPLAEADRNRAKARLQYRFGRDILHLAFLEVSPYKAFRIMNQTGTGMGSIIRNSFFKPAK